MSYFKTIVRFEVLSEGAPFNGSLEQLAAETTDGSMSGRFLQSEVTELTVSQAREALRVQGSDPDFLMGLSDEESPDQESGVEEEPFKLVGGSGSRLECNEDLVKDLLNHSPYGAMGQVFVMEAIRHYSAAVAGGELKDAPIDKEVWKRISVDVKQRMEEFYARHDRQGARTGALAG